MGALRSPLEIFRLEKQIIFLAPKCASSSHRRVKRQISFRKATDCKPASPLLVLQKPWVLLVSWKNKSIIVENSLNEYVPKEGNIPSRWTVQA